MAETLKVGRPSKGSERRITARLAPASAAALDLLTATWEVTATQAVERSLLLTAGGLGAANRAVGDEAKPDIDQADPRSQ